MPKRSNNSFPKLNSTFTKALKGVDIARSSYINSGGTECCGITELTFDYLVNGGLDWDNSQDGEDFDEKTIAGCIEKYRKGTGMDHRIFIVGLPVKNSDGHESDYNFKQYRKLRDILLSFGFKQLTRHAYINKNSGNWLSVLAVQV